MDHSFKDFTLKQKAQFIWDYYRWHILIAVIVAGIAASMLANRSKTETPDIYCLIFNDVENEALESRILDNYSAFAGSDSVISVDRGYAFLYQEDHGINWPDQAAVIKYMALPSTHEADVILCDYPSMLWANCEEFLTPVENALPAELSETLSPYYIYAVYPDDTSGEGDGIAYGLDISGTEFYAGMAGNYAQAVLCFPNVSENPKAAETFTRMVFGLPVE